MADDPQKEFDPTTPPRRRLWPALLVIPFLAVLAWWFGWGTNERANPALAGLPLPDAPAVDTQRVRIDTTGLQVAPPAASVPGAPAPVNDYLAFVDESRDGEPALDGARAAEGLRRLAAALVAVAEARDLDTPTIPAQADSLRGVAGAIAAEPNAVRHANLTRHGLLAAAGALPYVRGADTTAVLTEQLDTAIRAAGAVRPQTPLAQQGEAVQRAFDAIGSVLGTMARVAD